MSEKLKTVKLASLVEDFDLYPRNSVDKTHISDIIRAVQSGMTMPPLIAETKTLRLVDGFHRRRALLRVLGEDATYAVELRKYATDAELFLDAVALNAHHGRKLDRHDQTRVVNRLREWAVPDAVIAVTLHVPERTIQSLAVRVVYDPQQQAIPLKRGMGHLKGQQLSDAQIAAAGTMRSAEAGRAALELTRMIQQELVDWENPEIVERLRTLAAVLTKALQARAA